MFSSLPVNRFRVGFLLNVTEAGRDGYGVKSSVVKRAHCAMTHLFTERELSHTAALRNHRML